VKLTSKVQWKLILRNTLFRNKLWADRSRRLSDASLYPTCALTRVTDVYSIKRNSMSFNKTLFAALLFLGCFQGANVLFPQSVAEASSANPCDKIDKGTGPYIRFCSKPEAGHSFVSATVSLPPATDQPIQGSSPGIYINPETKEKQGDAAYLYLGGWGKDGKNAVDAGLQYSSTRKSWTLFIRYAKPQNILCPANGSVIILSGVPATPGALSCQVNAGGFELNFLTGTDIEIQFHAYGDNRLKIEAHSKTSPSQSAKVELDFSKLVNDRGTRIFNSWNASEQGIMLKRMTTIGQKGGREDCSTGSYIKGVHWSNVRIGRSPTESHPWRQNDIGTRKLYGNLITITSNGDGDDVHSIELNSSRDCSARPTGNLKQATSYGDPHFITFDGYRYDLQTVGEFVLTKTQDNSFEVQARQFPISPSLSLNSAIAMRIGQTQIAFYAKDFPDGDTSTPLRIDGKPVPLSNDSLELPGDIQVANNGSTYMVILPTQERVLINFHDMQGYKYIDTSLMMYEQPSGRFSGLLGNMNGTPEDDQQIQGGDVLPITSVYGAVNELLNTLSINRIPVTLNTADKLYFQKLHKDYANSWRVTPDSSLFGYPPGKTTENFSDRNFPDEYLRPDMLPNDRLQRAFDECRAAGVDQNLIEGCIYDVGFSGFSGFARTAAKVKQYASIAEELFPQFPLPGKINDFLDNPLEAILHQIIPHLPHIRLPW
jgi:hypothetical protein